MRRYLDAGRFGGAFRGPDGAWRVPAGDLEGLGLMQADETGPADTEAGTVAELRRRLAVAEALAAERQRTIDALLAAIGRPAGCA